MPEMAARKGGRFPPLLARLPAPLQGLRFAVALLALGALHALAFAPGPLPGWALPWLQWLALAVLAGASLTAPRPRRAAALGFLFGLGQFTTGLYWLTISMHVHGGLPLAAAIAALLLFSAALALFPALATGAAAWLAGGPAAARSHPLRSAATWAACWGAAEWLRGTLLTGLPWLNVGYAHLDSPLAGWAPLGGVYAVAWLAAFAAAALAIAVITARPAPSAAPLKPGRGGVPLAIAVLAALAGLGLGALSWTQPAGSPLVVRLTQGNVPQSLKFDPRSLQHGVETYLALAAQPPRAAGAEPGLIVLPETVMPLFQDQFPPALWQRWRDIAAHQGATLLLGAPLRQRQPDGSWRYTNSVIGLDAATDLPSLLEGRPASRYDKSHLVPFGEFIPPGFRWFVDAMNIPLGDFDRGTPGQALPAIAGQRIAPNICYEDVFGEEILQAVRHDGQGPGASLLVNVSNLGWFGDSWALRQHLQIARMRSLETERPMLRATNTGMTAAIAPDGQVRAALPAHVRGVLDVEVQGRQGLTPYVRGGNLPILAWMATLLALAAWHRRRITKE